MPTAKPKRDTLILDVFTSTSGYQFLCFETEDGNKVLSQRGWGRRLPVDEVINAIQAYFDENGRPWVIRTDALSVFCNAEFRGFMVVSGVQHIISPLNR